jgi:hypothetical protein
MPMGPQDWDQYSWEVPHCETLGRCASAKPEMSSKSKSSVAGPIAASLERVVDTGTLEQVLKAVDPRAAAAAA